MKGTLMSEQYSGERSEQIAENLRSMPLLGFDELMILRSIHGKLDGYRMIRRERSTEPDDHIDLDLRLLW
jgi:hypothetical protein